MAYADYEFYTNTYFGSAIKAEDFPRLALRASSFLDYYTQGRAEKNSDLPAVKMACCAIAEQYQMIETAQTVAQKSMSYSLESNGQEVSSESVGSWSKSYKSGAESASAAIASVENSKQLLADIAKQYLYGTGLLYRGGRCGKCRCSRTL